MNVGEARAKEYLESLGYLSDEIVHEPDSIKRTVPPDFAVCGRLAVEVRRLDKGVEKLSASEGLDVAARPFHDFFEKILREFGPPSGSHSWFVCYEILRPALTKPTFAANKKALRSAIKSFLTASAQGTLSANTRKGVLGLVDISVYPSAIKFADHFVLGSPDDTDASGWVVPDMFDNINRCIAEKTRKIEPYKSKYSEWWLILIDTISRGTLDADDISQIRLQIEHSPSWDKVLVLNPRGDIHAFTVSPAP